MMNSVMVGSDTPSAVKFFFGVSLKNDEINNFFYRLVKMGKRFGKYHIDKKVAIGGMAEIFKAHTTVGESVAIKKIHPDLAVHPKFVQMFLDEARIIVGLRHPNIVQLYDFGRIDSTYFFSLEWVDGKALSEIISRQTHLKIPFPIDVALFLILDVCEGLHYAHEKTDRFDRPLGIVHRDISPPNIIVMRNGVAKVADFGIAWVRNKTIKTQPGIIRGKFSYMSPEQSLGKDIDLRSDIFSLGIVLYELLMSTRLFLRDREPETIEAVRKCKIPPMRSKRGDISSNLEKIVKKSLAQNPKNRFSSAKEFGDALRNVLIQEFPHSDKHKIVEFLRTVFSKEIFYDVGNLLGDGLKKKQVRQTKREVNSWVRIPLEHPYLIALILGMSCLLFAEIFIQYL